MTDQLFQYFVVFFLGLVIYLKNPRLLFIYWLSVQPIVMPIYFTLFPVTDKEEFWDLYAKGIAPVSYLCVLIFIIKIIRGKIFLNNNRRLLFSAALIVTYIGIQNILVHFDISTIKNGFVMIMHIVIPLLLLLNCDSVRPRSNVLLNYSFFIVILELFFCCLNFTGFKVYPNAFEIYNYEDHLVSGTFARFNHLTNYLSTLFLFLSIEFFYFKRIKKNIYLFISAVIGLIILVSGSRMSLLLFVFLIFSFLYLYKRKSFVFCGICSALLITLFLFKHSINQYSIAEQDEGSGLQRSTMGITSFIQSDISEGNSTVSLSAYLLFFEFHNPVFGNGYAYMGEEGYDRGDFAKQNVFIADAHLAYMLVEYGILGCFIFFILFSEIFKCIYRKGIITNKKVISIVAIYYILNTITDMGLFDMSLLAFLYIFLFANESIQEKNNHYKQVCVKYL